MRLKKAKKEEYKNLIRSSDFKKLMTIDETQEIKWAWAELRRDHYGKLRLELERISKYKLLDMMESDVLQDGTRIFDTQCYFKRYSDFEISRIEGEIRKAQATLAYLQNLVIAEKNRRKK